MMLATFVIAAVLSIYTERSFRQRRVVNQLLAKHGIAFYTVEDGTPFPQQFVASKVDFWNHFRYSVKMVVLQPTADEPTDEQLAIVSRMPRVDYLYVWPGGMKNNDNQPLKRNADGGLTDNGIDVLTTEMAGLQHFVTTSANCSPERLRELDDAMKSAKLLTVIPHKNSNTEPLFRNRPKNK